MPSSSGSRSLQALNLKIKGLQSLKVLGTTHPKTQRKIPKYGHPHHHTDLMSCHRQHLHAIKYLQHKDPEI
jgi:hypothetical protein